MVCERVPRSAHAGTQSVPPKNTGTPRHTGGGAARDLPVVVTVPTSFGAPQREATLAAARAAGFEKVRLADEAIATAIAYQSECRLRGTAVVYDLGGGTFDVSVVECENDGVRVLSRASEPFLNTVMPM